MLRWISLVLVLLIIVVGVLEYTAHKTPLEQLLFAFSRPSASSTPGGPSSPKTVIRLGIASWQLREFPWTAAFAAYEKAHHDIRILATPIPEGAINSMLLFWASGHTEFDCVVAWSDGEIHPFIDYNWTSPDPERRALIINVRDPKYLSPQQLDSIVPSLWAGCSRTDPVTHTTSSYEIPWMGEVLALNYNKQYFRERGILHPPRTWEEVEEVCKKLKGLAYEGNPVYPLIMNFDQLGFFTQNCYVPMLAAFKEGRGIADDQGRLDVSSPEAVEVFETIKRWYLADYISPHAFVSNDAEQDLRTLRAVMYPHWQSRGLWALSDHGPDVIGIAPSPGSDVAGSLIGTYGAIIPRCSPHIPETIRFCYEALTTDACGFQSGISIGWPDPNTGKLHGGGKMPVFKSMYDDPRMPADIVSLGKGLSNAYTIPDPRNCQFVEEIVAIEFQKYLLGGHPSAQAALAAVRERLALEVYPPPDPLPTSPWGLAHLRILADWSAKIVECA